MLTQMEEQNEKLVKKLSKFEKTIQEQRERETQLKSLHADEQKYTNEMH